MFYLPILRIFSGLSCQSLLEPGSKHGDHWQRCRLLVGQSSGHSQHQVQQVYFYAVRQTRCNKNSKIINSYYVLVHLSAGVLLILVNTI